MLGLSLAACSASGPVQGCRTGGTGIACSRWSKPETEPQRRTSLAVDPLRGSGSAENEEFCLGSYALSAGVAVALLAGCGGSQLPIGNGGVPSALVPAASKTETFHYTGKKQTFIVPPGVTRIRVKAMGAGTMSARGGLAAATIAVQPGESLAIFVGGAPKGMQGGYNGGGTGGYCNLSNYPSCPLVGEGGAGASDVREGGNSVKNRVLVAGGAGGTGGKGQHHGGAGGGGGGLTGIHGHAGKGCFIASPTPCRWRRRRWRRQTD